MAQQVLNDLRVIPVLPQQRRVAVAKSVPPFQWDPHLCSNRLDVVLHNSAHALHGSPVGNPRYYANWPGGPEQADNDSDWRNLGDLQIFINPMFLALAELKNSEPQ